MSYENAPATKMLATHCAVCRRSLVDSVSVEIGMGPDCRKRHGYLVDGVSDENRAAANVIIHRLALGVDQAQLAAELTQLALLGFTKLAGVVGERCSKVQVHDGPGGLWVKTPYSPEAAEDFRRIPGRMWHGTEKVNIIPDTRRRDLWTLIRRHYPGALGVGPKGFFTVPA